jgi:ribonucleoside-triphosphate reductase
MLCTAKKMIPTYLLCDSNCDKNINPEKLSVMGCRTRVVDDLFGEKSAIGRGNICNISINLPRLAFEIERDFPAANAAEKSNLLYRKWLSVAEKVKDILLDRYERTLKNDINCFPANFARNIWCENFQSPKNVLKHGTISIGFIGLSETMEVLFGKRFYTDDIVYQFALDFVKKMRAYCDEQRDKYHLNFSLLATSGELISGRFLQIDKMLFPSYGYIFDKGFYTNSFHINVDSGLSLREKIGQEGPFHLYCNGGSISYVELNEAPIGNSEGLLELIEVGIQNGVRYLGVNFPKDICNDCGLSGVFDECPKCKSKHITRIRRVSGYLEILDGFTFGKKNEAQMRISN